MGELSQKHIPSRSKEFWNEKKNVSPDSYSVARAEQRSGIGEVGNTSGKYTLGPHLHFELATANTSGAPGDPWRQFYREKYKSLISYDIECYGDVSANPEDVKEWIRNNGILLK